MKFIMFRPIFSKSTLISPPPPPKISKRKSVVREVADPKFAKMYLFRVYVLFMFKVNQVEFHMNEWFIELSCVDISYDV